MTTLLAPFSCACLVALACWFTHLILSECWAYTFPAIGAVFVLCIATRSVSYWLARGETQLIWYLPTSYLSIP